MSFKVAISQIRSEAAKWEEQLEPAATTVEIDEFQRRALNQLGVKVPEEYIDFLRVVNGLEFNGLIFYGTKNSALDLRGSPLDLIEINKVLRQDSRAEFLELIVVGENGTGILVYDNGTKKFQYRDRIGIERVEEYSSLAQLLEREFGKVL